MVRIVFTQIFLCSIFILQTSQIYEMVLNNDRKHDTVALPLINYHQRKWKRNVVFDEKQPQGMFGIS